MTEADPRREIEHLALRLLAAREHSRWELAHKLAARGYPQTQIDEVIDRLTEQGALCESRLAEAYVAERARKGFGPLRIRAELKDKGLSDDRIDPYLRAMSDAWPAVLAEAHERRFGPLPPADHAEFGRRGRFLEQRGFPSDLIRRHLRWND
jgi:regulatory protein